MTVKFTFNAQGKSVELSPKELHDLHNATTFALSGSSISSKTFGVIHVETSGRNSAFSANQRGTQIQTDC